jgi:hypothetical protein
MKVSGGLSEIRKSTKESKRGGEEMVMEYE